jgi:hypothetical protein
MPLPATSTIDNAIDASTGAERSVNLSLSRCSPAK